MSGSADLPFLNCFVAWYISFLVGGSQSIGRSSLAGGISGGSCGVGLFGNSLKRSVYLFFWPPSSRKGFLPLSITGLSGFPNCTDSFLMVVYSFYCLPFHVFPFPGSLYTGQMAAKLPCEFFCVGRHSLRKPGCSKVGESFNIVVHLFRPMLPHDLLISSLVATSLSTKVSHQDGNISSWAIVTVDSLQ